MATTPQPPDIEPNYRRTFWRGLLFVIILSCLIFAALVFAFGMLNGGFSTPGG